MKNGYLDFDEYICQGEPQQRERAEVFAIKYLRSQGFQVNNELFEQHSWYFRNALVRANYRNLSKGISYEPLFLIRFFRNLLLGEKNILKNRYMIVDYIGGKNIQVPEQVPEQAVNILFTNNTLIFDLVKIIGHNEFSISQLMEKIGLKHRPNFMEYHLNPAISEGYVRLLYPDKSRHPKQKYLLTVRGMALYKELTK